MVGAAVGRMATHGPMAASGGTQEDMHTSSMQLAQPAHLAVTGGASVEVRRF